MRVAKSCAHWQIRSVLREPLHVMLRELAAVRCLSPDNVAAEAAFDYTQTKSSMKILSLAGIVWCAWAVALQGQAVPRWSLEAAVGSGAHNDRAGEVYYNNDNTAMIRYAFGYRLGSARRTAAYVTAEYSAHANGDQVQICRLAPNGTCRKYFEDNAGAGVGIGVRHAMTTAAVLGAQTGLGRYDSHFREFVEGSVLLRLASHIGLVGAARYMRWSHAGAAQWYAPLTVGIQLF